MHDRVPFRVCRVLHDAAVQPVAFPQTKVLVVTAGWTNLTHRERTVSLAEGDIAVLPTGALVGGAPLTEAETVTLYVDPDFLHEQLSWARLSTPIANTVRAAADGVGQIVTLRPSSLQRRTITTQARVLADHDSSSEAAGFRLLSASLRFLDTLTSVTTPTPLTIPRREVRVIVAAFRRDLAHPWSMTRLSHQVNLSTSQLTRAFNAVYGAPPMQVLTRLRVEKLAELLQMTNWSVQRCAAAVGWDDADHAANMMKRIYGITPTECRGVALASSW